MREIMVKKLIKYPGSKLVIIPDIRRIFLESGQEYFVDVFGGSGSVSLNIAGKVVYNDINDELCNLFRVIRSRPDEFLRMAARWTVSKEKFYTYGKSIEEKGKDGENGVSLAFRTFYIFNTRFGGMGETYSTTREKSAYSSVLKILNNFDFIRDAVSKWQIENMDFRELIRKLDSSRSFFYLDPPYPGKNWYRYNFRESDFTDMRDLLKDVRGKYLMNFNAEDQLPHEIFGEASLVKGYPNRNGKYSESAPRFRYVSFYANFEIS
jgi:DNA adenine methylase